MYRAILLWLLLCISTADARFPPHSSGVAVGGSNSIAVSCPGTATPSASIVCSGTYTGTAPTTSGWTYAWNTTCSGSGTPTVSGISGNVITSITIATPSACAGTVTVTDNSPLSNIATSGTVTIAAPGPLTLNTFEAGLVGQSGAVYGNYPAIGPFYMGAFGTYSGTAPSSMTATWTGCGGGTATVHSLTANVYQTGDYLVQVNDPGVAGTGCTITVTDNLGRTATSPPTTVATNTSATTTYNLHNAPGWQASHSYTVTSGPHTRVNNGAGWTPGSPGNYNPGSALNAYELRSDSTSPCTSAASGGPSGTGSSISDGTCTWKYLSGVDYVTLTGFSRDAPPWTSKVYTYSEFVTTNVGGNFRAYMLSSASQSLVAWCNSTVAPTGAPLTGSAQQWYGIVTTADGCVWNYAGDVTYSSQREYRPFQTFADPDSLGQSHVPHNFELVMWNDAEYVAGSGGESNPISFASHLSGWAAESTPRIHCPVGCVTSIVVAPGDSFNDSLTPSSTLTGYDATKGVAIRNPTTTTWPGWPGGGPTALLLGDWFMHITGVQFQAPHGAALIAISASYVADSILDGGDASLADGLGCAWWSDTNSSVINSLVLSHGTTGICFKYGGSFVLWDTIVNVGSVSNTVAVSQGWAWAYRPVVVADTAMYGFAHGGAYQSAQAPQVFDAASANNVTDIASGDSGTTWFNNQANLATVIPIPGTTFSQTGANMFVSPGSDWRPGASLIGAGATFGTFLFGCPASGSCTSGINLNFDTPDFLGTVRPGSISGTYTVGPEQHP